MGPGRDKRRDADEGGSADGFRVDRVFDTGPVRRPITPPTPRRSKPGTLPPRPTTTEAADTELALRRQLSRLQRQLADARHELANKDDEIAAETEARLVMAAEQEKLVTELRAQEGRLEELMAYQARTEGIERRLEDTTEAADALSRAREQEEEQRIAAQARIKEMETALADAKTRWATERSTLEAHHGEEIAKLEAERKTAGDAAEASLAAITGRLQKAQEEQLVQLRESHEKSIAVLRGELEPKALEARTLAEERSRLTDQLAALQAEMTHALAERDEAHARELAQLRDTQAATQAATARTHAAELARIVAERDHLTAVVEQAKQSAVDREKLVDQTMTTLRETQKQLQREAAEAKESLAQLKTDHGNLTERLATATRLNEAYVEEQRDLRGALEAAEREARQNELDRERFVAYLEEGLAMIGALPPHESSSESSEDAVPEAAASEAAASEVAGEPEATAPDPG